MDLVYPCSFPQLQLSFLGFRIKLYIGTYVLLLLMKKIQKSIVQHVPSSISKFFLGVLKNTPCPSVQQYSKLYRIALFFSYTPKGRNWFLRIFFLVPTPIPTCMQILRLQHLWILIHQLHYILFVQLLYYLTHVVYICRSDYFWKMARGEPF